MFTPIIRQYNGNDEINKALNNSARKQGVKSKLRITLEQYLKTKHNDHQQTTI